MKEMLNIIKYGEKKIKIRYKNTLRKVMKSVKYQFNVKSVEKWFKRQV